MAGSESPAGKCVPAGLDSLYAEQADGDAGDNPTNPKTEEDVVTQVRQACRQIGVDADDTEAVAKREIKRNPHRDVRALTSAVLGQLVAAVFRQ